MFALVSLKEACATVVDGLTQFSEVEDLSVWKPAATSHCAPPAGAPWGPQMLLCMALSGKLLTQMLILI